MAKLAKSKVCKSWLASVSVCVNPTDFIQNDIKSRNVHFSKAKWWAMLALQKNELFLYLNIRSMTKTNFIKNLWITCCISKTAVLNLILVSQIYFGFQRLYRQETTDNDEMACCLGWAFCSVILWWKEFPLFYVGNLQKWRFQICVHHDTQMHEKKCNCGFMCQGQQSLAGSFKWGKDVFNHESHLRTAMATDKHNLHPLL